MYQDWHKKEGQKGDWVKELYQERSIMLGVYNYSRRIIILTAQQVRLIERL